MTATLVLPPSHPAAPPRPQGGACHQPSPRAVARSPLASCRKFGSESSELHSKAKTALAAFKRPSAWVLIFGWSLAACAGVVNAVCFGSFQLFVSHATGATTSISLGLEGYAHGENEFDKPRDAMWLLFSFLLGAFACGLLIDKNQVHFGGKALYGVALIGNAMLLLAAVVLFDSLGKRLVAACFASAACGLQNAMCTSHFGAVIRTTHVTGTITDIGSTTGRMAMILLRKRCRYSQLNVLERAEVYVDARKLLVLGPMWLCFFVGTLAGAILQHHLGVFGLMVPAMLTLSVGLAYTFFRPQLKHRLKMMEKRRLQRKIEQVNLSMERTRNVLAFLRRGKGAEAPGPGLPESVTEDIVLEIDEELGHVLECMHEVESDLEELYHPRSASFGDECDSLDSDSVQPCGRPATPSCAPIAV